MTAPAQTGRRFPMWAAAPLRIFLIAQGALLGISIPLSLVLFFLHLQCYTDSYCELTAAATIVLDAVTAATATGLVMAGLWLRRDPPRMLIAPVVILLVVVGEVLGVLVILTVIGSNYQASAAAYQLVSMLPLVMWPGVGSIITVVVGLLSAWGIAPRFFQVAWPLAAVLLSAFALTYVLPATDVRVATLHGQGLAKLPEFVQGLSDSRGLPVLAVVQVDHGNELALLPGDYTLLEGCIAHPTTNIQVLFHVTWGQLTVVSDHCTAQ
jgi:hypothetical protein